MSTFSIETIPFIADPEERAAYYDGKADQMNRNVWRYIIDNNLTTGEIRDSAVITYMLHQRDNYRALAESCRGVTNTLAN